MPDWSAIIPCSTCKVSALLSILRRYNWQHFGVLTTEIAGHDDFVQAIRDRIADEGEFRWDRDTWRCACNMALDATTSLPILGAT